MVNDGDHSGLVLGCMGCVGQVGYDLCGSGFWVDGWWWVDLNKCDAMAWVWWCNDLGSRCSGVGLVFDRGLRCFFFFGGVDGRLWVVGVVVVVSSVCSVAMVVIVVLEQKERERKNK